MDAIEGLNFRLRSPSSPLNHCSQYSLPDSLVVSWRHMYAGNSGLFGHSRLWRYSWLHQIDSQTCLITCQQHCPNLHDQLSCAVPEFTSVTVGFDRKPPGLEEQRLAVPWRSSLAKPSSWVKMTLGEVKSVHHFVLHCSLPSVNLILVLVRF